MSSQVAHCTYPDYFPVQFKKQTPTGDGVHISDLAEEVTFATLPVLACRLLQETDANRRWRYSLVDTAAASLGLPASDIMDILLHHQKRIEAARFVKPYVIVDASHWLMGDIQEADQILKDTFDAGDKVAIIGSSKRKKSFFLQQLSLCLAARRQFLKWVLPAPRRVSYVQFEVQPIHLHKRLKYLSRALDIKPADLGNRLQILNARGLGLSGPEGIKHIQAAVADHKPEVITFDPLYKIAQGAENQAEDMKLILNAFDTLAEQTGAAILYVHHDAKGSPGDRDIRDRGAGSNVIGRDYDCCLTLTAHATNDEATVVDTLLRNYRPQNPFAIRWAEADGAYHFVVDDGIVPERKTSKTKPPPPPLSSYLPAALSVLKKERLEIKSFKEKFKLQTGLSDSRISEFLSWATAGGNPTLVGEEVRGKGLHRKWIKAADGVA